ncbi:nucleotidyl transferase AbiEii/AbiGii toxin family protein [candidate division KSB1 bacterium]|nr:nucleotidyl transferase AbiEii/AbiGii toxin family protein [candidate division KSB1 bacterium]
MISIKIELDTNPPEGAKIVSSLLRKYAMLNIQHYDKSSLLAGKLYALFARKYVKGRDVYDLFWYLSDRS